MENNENQADTNKTTEERAAVFDPRCKLCVRERKEKEERQKKKMSKRKQTGAKRSRVAKSRKRSSYRRARLARTRSHSGVRFSRPGARARHLLTYCGRVKNLNGLSGEATNPVVKSTRSEPGSTSDAASARYPDTSHPSVTSYDSFLSMDHEPMVAEQ